jgi:hypothetical protein
MNVLNTIELKADGYEKCWAQLHSDCPLGQLYDFSCALQSFVLQKMKEAEELQKKAKAQIDLQQEAAKAA